MRSRITLTYRNTTGNTGADFKYRTEVRSEEELSKIVRYDYSPAEYKDNHRLNDNFLSADCIGFDFDNDNQKSPSAWDDPSEWVTPEDISKAFPDVEYIVHYSRNHLKEKVWGDGTVRTARPKFHVLFPIPECQDPEFFATISAAFNLQFRKDPKQSVIDESAMDISRMFFGTGSNTRVEWHEGSKSIIELLDFSDPLLQEDIVIERDPHTVNPRKNEEKKNSSSEYSFKEAMEYIKNNPNAYLRDRANKTGWICPICGNGSGADGDGLVTKDGIHFTCFKEGWTWASVIDIYAWEHGMARMVMHHTSRHEGFHIELASRETYEAVKGIAEEWYGIRIKDSDPERDFEDLGSTVMKETEVQEKKIDLSQDSNAAAITGFLQRINERGNEGYYISTGFPSLDKELGGGLYKGLFTIGAVSSLGKTSFCLQMADNIAKAGREVLIFSLEMPRDDLIAKSISRLTYQIEMKENHTHWKALTAQNVLSGKRNDDPEVVALRDKAIEEYQTYAGRIYCYASVGSIRVSEIREAVKKSVERNNGIPPVVFVDYLQILAPVSKEMERASDKQIVDQNITELKILSDKYNIPIIGISAFNRESYWNEVNQSSFKETGKIEYGSDVLIGLQYAGWNYADKEHEKDIANRRPRLRKLNLAYDEAAKKGNGIPLDLKVMKQRLAPRGSVELWFCPMFNVFSDGGELIDEWFNPMLECYEKHGTHSADIPAALQKEKGQSDDWASGEVDEEIKPEQNSLSTAADNFLNW